VICLIEGPAADLPKDSACPISQELQRWKFNARTSSAVQSIDMGLLPVACDTSNEVNSAMSFSPHHLLLVDYDADYDAKALSLGHTGRLGRIRLDYTTTFALEYGCIGEHGADEQITASAPR
jgi:hypothetical protein